MKPENANTRNCKVARVVFNNGDFSIACLYIISENENKLGCRWNYNYGTNNSNGSPVYGASPIWTYFPIDLVSSILKSIKGKKGTDEQNRIEVLQYFKSLKINSNTPRMI